MKPFPSFKRALLNGMLAALLLCSITHLSAHDSVPGAKQSQPVAIKDVMIVPVSGPVIEKGTIVFSEGKIAALGTDVAIPAGSKIIDGQGRRVVPAFIESWSYLGLREVGSVKATQDYDESGEINPNLHAHKAVNPDSELIPVTRANGIGLAITRPSGLIGGQASLIRLDGWTYEDMTLAPNVAMAMDWPQTRFLNVPWLPQQRRDEFKKKREKDLAALEAFVKQARHYQQAQDAAKEGKAKKPQPDPRLAAMDKVLRGEQRVWIRANRADEIHEAIDFCNRHDLKMVLVGGRQADQAVDQLKRYGIPVILHRTQALPSRRDEAYDHVYRMPAILHEAGVEFAITIGNTLGNDRNLPYQAAAAAAYGLDPAAALASITLAPAKIIGVADRVGSLEVGKDATLILCDGDPLEITTHVQAMFIEGAEVDLTSRHTRLWKKYETRIKRLNNGR
ncbi:amidohydrolase family protein [Acanthopleuribacter pedis]|uniref:Amidohydrolase family protein n=1 Tax=Acanthopleuribacter pedis TaxID=442870 RepID=A0A8J7QEY1_9BACT|nr:amidohydrolase family protein [Acanthopleuribacter pedis]MBO1317224.1 amidohydrolase family protein [Acanthopleuribacter pedis]MBO1318530.1 amidohydrolase family protein [Acanthopleuribacter pedis]